MRDIGKNIRDLRQRKNMTQDELAEQLFVTRQTVSNYETGRTRPDVDMVVKIAEILDTDANTVLYGIPTTPDRKREICRLCISAACLIVLLVFHEYIGDLVELYRAYYYVTWPDFMISILLTPCVYLLMGWTILQALGTFTKLSPITGKAAKWVRRMIYGAGIVYLGIMIPHVSRLWLEIDLPLFWGKLIFFLLGVLPGQLSLVNYKTVSFLFGILLWLFRVPKKEAA